MIFSFRDKAPLIPSNSLVVPSAVVIGDVILGEESSLWFNVVVRGDVNFIRIGDRTNIQDGSVVHVTHDTHPTLIGNEVTVGHHATLHGCTIKDGCLIGSGALVLDGAEIGPEVLVAAGSVVTPGTRISSRKLVRGVPAKIVRDLTAEEIQHLRQGAFNYVRYCVEYMDLNQIKISS